MDEHGNITGSFKKSKGGRLKLIKKGGTFVTVEQNELPEYADELITVFENGKLENEQTFEQVRALASK